MEGRMRTLILAVALLLLPALAQAEKAEYLPGTQLAVDCSKWLGNGRDLAREATSEGLVKWLKGLSCKNADVILYPVLVTSSEACRLLSYDASAAIQASKNGVALVCP